MYGFEQAYEKTEGNNRESLLDSLLNTLSRTEEAVGTADQEIRDDLETIRAEWNTSQIAIPAPPGSDEVSGDSFCHESAY